MSRKRNNSPAINWKYLIILAIVVIAGLVRVMSEDTPEAADPTVPVSSEQQTVVTTEPVTDSGIPEYSGEPYVALNGNEPEFGEIDPETEAYEYFSDLDELGRCGVVMACIDESLMPTEERGNISSVKPSGWQSVRYDFVDGGSLYNRCHLIGFQLTGENANEKNLVTGTRYMNVDGMLPFENMVADYVKETGMKVLYRVTPIFEGDELVPRGVQMEAYSIEDGGEGICYNVYCYNVQPGVEIDYATGESREEAFSCEHEPQELVLNTASGKFHTSDCSGAKDMNPDNRQNVTACPEELIAKGYVPCGSCDPAA